MQFLDNGYYLTVTELNDKNEVGIFMGTVGQELNESSMHLTEIEIYRLRDWLNKSIETLENVIESKTPS